MKVTQILMTQKSVAYKGWASDKNGGDEECIYSFVGKLLGRLRRK
jgi:hypothetical protein